MRHWRGLRPLLLLLVWIQPSVVRAGLWDEPVEHFTSEDPENQNNQLERTASFALGKLTTSRQMLSNTWRSTSSESSFKTWVLGCGSARQQDVAKIVEDLGGRLLHSLPGPSPHWLVHATLGSVVQLLKRFEEVSAEELPYSFKQAPDVSTVVKLLAAHGTNAKRLARAAQRAGITVSPGPEGALLISLQALIPQASPKLQQGLVKDARKQLPELLSESVGPCNLGLQITRTGLQVVVCIQGVAAVSGWLAGQPSITWVSISQRPSHHNLQASAVMQSPETLSSGPPGNDLALGSKGNLLPLWAAGLDGAGQVVGVTDTGLDLNSCYLYDPDAGDYRNSSDTYSTPLPPWKPLNTLGGWVFTSKLGNVSVYWNKKHRKVVQYVMWADGFDGYGHGTHVSGTIAGAAHGRDPLTSPDIGTGVAPNARIAMFDAGGWNSTTRTANSNLDFIMEIGQDPGMVYDIQYQAGARITSNSWGSWRPHTSLVSDAACFVLDSYAHMVRDMLHVFSAGNSGSVQGYFNESGTVGTPGRCKNVLTVGATENWVPFQQGFNVTQNDAQVAYNASDYGSPAPMTAGSLSFTITYGNGSEAVIDIDAAKSQMALMYSMRSSLTGLTGHTFQLVAANPADGCSALRSASWNTSTLLLFRKRLGGCRSREAVTAAFNSGAAGALIFWEDVPGLVFAQGPELNTTTAYPSAIIAGNLGRALFYALNTSQANVTGRFIPYTGNATFAPYENVAYFSSYGSNASHFESPKLPMLTDARIKPDLVASGMLMSAASDFNFTAPGQDQCGVTLSVGTSMSTPVVAGAAALVRQYMMDGYACDGARHGCRGFEPSAPLVKAMLLAGTVAMLGVSRADGAPLEPPPSMYQGFGRLDLSRSLPLKGNPQGWGLQFVDQAFFPDDGLQHTYTVRVAPGAADTSASQPLIVTLVWHDPPAFPGALWALVNNLDLIVQYVPPGDQPPVAYWGNNITGGDFLNNVEKVFIPAAPAGAYAITVRSTYLFTAARPQYYALTVHGALDTSYQFMSLDEYVTAHSLGGRQQG